MASDLRKALASAVIACLAVSSAADGGSGGLTPEAVLEELQLQYGRHHALEAEFVQTVRYVEFDTEQRSHGRVFIKKPGRMRMEVEKPQEQLIITDGDTLWIYTPEHEQVLRRVLGDVERSFQPAAILFGDSEIAYRFRLVGEAEEGAAASGGAAEAGSEAEAPLIILELTPLDANPYVSHFILSIDRSTWHVMRLVIDTGAGTVTTFGFGHGWRETSLPDSLFQFIPPAGVETFDVQ